MEIIEPNKEILKMHILVLEKLEMLSADERKYFFQVLQKLSTPPLILKNDRIE